VILDLQVLARAAVLGLLLLVFLAGCGRQPGAIDEFFPEADVPTGWTPTGALEVFDSESLYDLVNGQAEAYFAYGFEQAAVRNYQNAANATLRVTLWQLGTPEDAFGLFTTTVFGSPANIGNDGDTVSGRRIAFWQSHYYAELFASAAISDAELQALASAVSANLPSGGEGPELVDRLPAQGLIGRSTVFFHQEISIQDRLWLGSENVLGLSPETSGVLAQYDIGTARAQLLLVQYLSAEAAEAGLAALDAAGTSGLAAASTQGAMLGAVFGEIDAPAAADLLARGLDNP
jgi:hypothetical protein